MYVMVTYMECLLDDSTYHGLFHLILITTLCDEYYHPHFMDGKTEA